MIISRKQLEFKVIGFDHAGPCLQVEEIYTQYVCWVFTKFPLSKLNEGDLLEAKIEGGYSSLKAADRYKEPRLIISKVERF
jgi:hypothetical protein